MATGQEPADAGAAPRCGCCGVETRPRVPDARDTLTGELFGIAVCPVCGLGHTQPQPADLGRYYAARYYGNRHGVTLRHCTRRRLKFVTAAAGRGSGRRLLDIGCGDGSFLLLAQRAGWEVVGTELNPEPARSAGLEVLHALEQLPSGPAFDCITLWHTLEHMRDPAGTLERARSLLKPGGSLLVAVPDWGGWQARVFRRRWLHLDVPRHLFHFTAASLRRCLVSAGFSVGKLWHQEFEYDLLGWSQSALNCLMGTPNVFFHCLTGKSGDLGVGSKAVGLTLGALLTVVSLPVLVAGTALGRGGTLVAAARPGSPGGANRGRGDGAAP